jgi:hypothetical protein
MLKEGDIIELKDGHEVYADVPEHLIYSYHKGPFKITRGKIKIGGKLAYFAGQYVVYKTTNDGGGTGHGPHDIYPNGHHVFCERLDDQSVKVDFYQSGCFTAMIEQIEPIARAKRRWVLEA